MTEGTILAIAVRHGVAAIATIECGCVINIVRRHFAFTPKGMTDSAYIGKKIAALVGTDYLATIIVEPGSIAERAVLELGLVPERLTLGDAGERLWPHNAIEKQVDLFGHLLGEYQELDCYVQVLPGGRVAMTERWRTVNLLAAALGLAYLRQPKASRTTTTSPTDSTNHESYANKEKQPSS